MTVSLGFLKQGNTIQARMDSTGGRTNGFDLLRILLAVSVVSYHSVYTTFGWDNWIWGGDFRALPMTILPVFFALSGFLVAGSLFRNRSLSGFITLRILRLAPALFVEVCLSALILGPMVTKFTLSSYLSGNQFSAYFLNIFGDIHYHLPGVFSDDPAAGIVNMSLWTVPYELQCYILLTVLTMTGIVFRDRRLLCVIVGASIVFPLYDFLIVGIQWASRPPGSLLVLSFLFGLLIFCYRAHIRLNRPMFLVSVFASLLFLSGTRTVYLAPAFVAYATVYLGLMNFPKVPFLSTGDYSYGLYLYGFPIQQTFEWAFPNYRIWWLNIIVSVPVGFLFAMFSWHVIEKRVLSRRKAATALVERLQAAAGNIVKRYWVARQRSRRGAWAALSATSAPPAPDEPRGAGR